MQARPCIWLRAWVRGYTCDESLCVCVCAYVHACLLTIESSPWCPVFMCLRILFVFFFLPRGTCLEYKVIFFYGKCFMEQGNIFFSFLCCLEERSLFFGSKWCTEWCRFRENVMRWNPGPRYSYFPIIGEMMTSRDWILLHVNIYKCIEWLIRLMVTPQNLNFYVPLAYIQILTTYALPNVYLLTSALCLVLLLLFFSHFLFNHQRLFWHESTGSTCHIQKN